MTPVAKATVAMTTTTDNKDKNIGRNNRKN